MGNHLILVADDIGVPGIESYARERRAPHWPETPCVGALEARGVRFDGAYVYPLCSPSRTCLQTGRYGFRTGVGENVFNQHTVPDSTPKWLAEVLADTHDTGYFGKWHLANASNGGGRSPLAPEKGGVAHWKTFAGPIANLRGQQDYFTWVKFTGGKSEVVGGPLGSRETAAYATTVTVDDALAWIGSRKRDWCAVVAFNAAHRPYQRPPTAGERAPAPPLVTPRMEAVLDGFAREDAEWLEAHGWDPGHVATAIWMAMIEAMDTEIGRLVAGIDFEETTVWFLTDNGPDVEVVEAPFNPFHAKGTQYDLSTYTPLVVCGKGVAESGVTCRRIVHLVDVLPTVAAMEGIDLAEKFPGHAFDGVDVSRFFRDHRAPEAHEFVFTELFSPQLPILDAETGVTTDPERRVEQWFWAAHDGAWSLLKLMPDGPRAPFTYELYHLAKDGTQAVDLIVDQARAQSGDPAERLAGCGGRDDAAEALARLLACADDLLPPS